jgi:transcriptional regulator with XRE-family HTH domain
VGLDDQTLISAQLGAVIRKLREESGESIEALALDAEIDPSYLSGIERGLRNPSWEKTEPIAAALGVKLSTLVLLAEQLAENSDEPVDR